MQDIRPSVRWSAPEVISHHLFSTSSDVWSYAVLVWQILACAQQPPYWAWSDSDVIHAVTRGFRLPPPPVLYLLVLIIASLAYIQHCFRTPTLHLLRFVVRTSCIGSCTTNSKMNPQEIAVKFAQYIAIHITHISTYIFI